MLADGDDRPLLDAVQELEPVLAQLEEDNEIANAAAVPITNVAAIAALGLRRGRLGLFAAGKDVLQTAYGKRVDTGASALPVFEHTAASVLAIAAVAIELEDWLRVRELVVQSAGDDAHYATWLRHGQVEAARAAFQSEDDNLVELAAGKLGLHPAFGKFGASLEDRLGAICIADQAALIAVASLIPDAEQHRQYFPSYAKFPAQYVEPLLISLRHQEGPARAALFPHQADQMVHAIRDANELALHVAAGQRRGGFDWKYAGIQSYELWFYLRSGGDLEERWRLRS